MKILLSLIVYLNFFLNMIFCTETKAELLHDDQFKQTYINNFVANRSTDLYSEINSKGRISYPQSTQDKLRAEGWESESFWNLLWLCNNKFLISKDDINLSLQQFFNGATIDCIVAKDFVTLKIIQELVGPHNFATLVNIYKEVFENVVLFDIRYERSFTHIFLEQINDISLGSLVYLHNHPLYATVHYDDVWVGFDVVQVGFNKENDNLYMGFWPESSPKARSIKDINDHFFNAFSKDMVSTLRPKCESSYEEVKAQFEHAKVRTNFDEKIPQANSSPIYQMSLDRLQRFFERNPNQECTWQLKSSNIIKNILLSWKNDLNQRNIVDIILLSKETKLPKNKSFNNDSYRKEVVDHHHQLIKNSKDEKLQKLYEDLLKMVSYNSSSQGNPVK